MFKKKLNENFTRGIILQGTSIPIFIWYCSVVWEARIRKYVARNGQLIWRKVQTKINRGKIKAMITSKPKNTDQFNIKIGGRWVIQFSSRIPMMAK